MSDDALRVLFLTHSWPRVPGDAAGSFLWHLAVALRGQGVDVRVVAPAAPGLSATDVFDGVRVERFRYAPRRWETLAYTGNMAQDVQRSWAARLALVGFLGAEFTAATRLRREFQPHLIHAHWWFPGGLAGVMAARLGGIPLVTTMHGSDVRLARVTTGARPLLRHVLRHSAGVTTVSRWLAAEVTAIVPSARPVVAPMPVDVQVFAPASSPERRRLLFVGRLNRQKGIADLLEACGLMTTAAELDVVGDGPDREALQSRARELGVADRIRWHGALPQPSLVPFYQQAAALVVPSVGEGLGLVAVEAQLCETPVVAYDSGGLRDTIRDGETGCLVPEGNIPRLAQALDGLLSNEGRHAMGRSGRMNALANFAPESAARRYREIYRAALER